MSKRNLFAYSFLAIFCFYGSSHAMDIVPSNTQNNKKKCPLFYSGIEGSKKFIDLKEKKDKLLNLYQQNKNKLSFITREDQIIRIISQNNFLLDEINTFEEKNPENKDIKSAQKKLVSESEELRNLHQEIFIDAKRIIEIPKKQQDLTDAIQFFAKKSEDLEVKEIIKNIEVYRTIIDLFMKNRNNFYSSNSEEIKDFLNNLTTLATINPEFAPLTQEEIENRDLNEKRYLIHYRAYTDPYEAINYYNKIDKMFWRNIDKYHNFQIKKLIIAGLTNKKDNLNAEINQKLHDTFAGQSISLVQYITTIIEPELLMQKITVKDGLESLSLDKFNKYDIKQEDLPKTLSINYNDSTLEKHIKIFNGRLKEELTILNQCNDKQAHEFLKNNLKTISDNKLHNFHNHNIQMDFDHWNHKNPWQRFLWTKKPTFLLAALKTKVSSLLSWFKFW